MIYRGKSKRTAKSFLTLEEELKEVHSGKYLYDNAVFVNARTVFSITCPAHGDFMQQPRAHKQGQGCPKCGAERAGSLTKKTTDEVYSELRAACDGRFVLPCVEDFVYTTAHGRVDTVCVTCGAKDHKKINSILTGHFGCKNCVSNIKKWTEERYVGKPATLYYIKIGNLFKIGITCSSVANRFRRELAAGLNIEVLRTIGFKEGTDAFKEEQRILKEFQTYKYKGDKVLISGGDTELFTRDVLNLDTAHGGDTSI